MVYYVWRNAVALKIDRHRTHITGLSVSGQMELASLFLLRKVLEDEDLRHEK